ncbi:MAG: dipeptide/oligopeptide/nickel ABC transporter ATP-binding protein [Desulfurococcaceae archaeon]
MYDVGWCKMVNGEPETPPILEFRNVVAGYMVVGNGLRSLFKKPLIVLHDVSFKLHSGERVAVVGESGSGKTTLIKVALGLLKPFKGEVLVFGVPIYRLPWRKRVELTRRIGYVPQDPYRALNPTLSIEQILAEPLEALKLDGKEIKRRIEVSLELVRLPKNVLSKVPDELSGGMKQRVLIARALVHKPHLLILDEPTSALDVSIQAQIINLLNEIHATLGIAMITVTHDLSVAQYLADRVIVIKNGRIEDDGPFWSILESPRSEYVKMLILSYRKLSENA